MPDCHVLSCDQVRQIDRIAIDDLGIPGLVLMENAGRGIVDLLRVDSIEAPVLIACGPGNNGGDGYVIARHLDSLGVEVHLILACDPDRLRGDADQNFRWLDETHVQVHRLDDGWPNWITPSSTRFSWVVDALLGTGSRGTPRAPYGELIHRLNRIDARHLAVDIPSGLDGETGEPSESTFRAELTGTFVAAKTGLVTPAAKSYVGRLEVIEIGVPRRILERFGLQVRRN